MIVFDLTCMCGSQFEAWFQDRLDYDTQREKGLLECPECGGRDIHKILSAVAGRKSLASPSKMSDSSVYEPTPIQSEQEVKELINTLSRYVKENYQDVGSRLAEKALKMHFGVEESKKIRGVVTAKEEQMLADEGIELVKIPMPLDDTENKN